MKYEEIHLLVFGRVQGVGFRYWTVRKAGEFGLVGWVRNRPDGSVEIFAVGSPEKTNIFLDWCGHGPSGAYVSKVTVCSKKNTAGPLLSTFEVRYN